MAPVWPPRRCQRPADEIRRQEDGESRRGSVGRRHRINEKNLAGTLGVSIDAMYRADRINSSTTQVRTREMLEILGRIADWAGGEVQAMAWYRGQPIPAFGGRTAESLVKANQAGPLCDYLDHMAMGGFAWDSKEEPAGAMTRSGLSRRCLATGQRFMARATIQNVLPRCTSRCHRWERSTRCAKVFARIAPMTSVEYEVDCTDIEDLTDASARALLGIAEADMACNWGEDALIRGKTPASWAIATQLIAGGSAGIIVPSYAPEAASDRRNLVLWKWGSRRPHRVRA